MDLTEYEYLVSSLTEQSIVMSWTNTQNTGIFSTEYLKSELNLPTQISSFFTKCTE
jgi:hypothetical protein